MPVTMGRGKGMEMGKGITMGGRGGQLAKEWLLDVDDEIDEPTSQTAPVQSVAPPTSGGKGRSKGKGSAQAATQRSSRRGEDPKVEAECWRVVFRDKVAVRSEPRTTASVIGAKMPGARVYVDHREGDWVLLHADMYDGRQAWMLVDGIAQGHGKLLEQEIEKWCVVFKDKVVVRSEPSLTGQILGARQPGDFVKVSYSKGEWVRLHSSEGFDGKAAWMLADGSAKGLGILMERIGTFELAAEATIDLDIPASTKPPERTPANQPAKAPSSAAPIDVAAELQTLQEEITELRMDKAEAVEEEDFDRAAEINAKLKAAEARQKELQGAKKESNTNPAVKLRELKAELQRLTREKNQAAEDEEYDLAAELKKQIKGIEAQIAELEAALQQSAEEMEQVRRELAQVKSAKLKAVEEEDFKEAAALKKQEQALDAKLKELMGASA